MQNSKSQCSRAEPNIHKHRKEQTLLCLQTLAKLVPSSNACGAADPDLALSVLDITLLVLWVAVGERLGCRVPHLPIRALTSGSYKAIRFAAELWYLIWAQPTGRHHSSTGQGGACLIVQLSPNVQAVPPAREHPTPSCETL